MRLSVPLLLGVLIQGVAAAPTVGVSGYQSADVALHKLERVVTLSPAQEAQALQIYQDLKDIMDDRDPADRLREKSRFKRDAIAAIRGILTPEQRAVYDRTPQRLGGGSSTVDPATGALLTKIRTFVTDSARTSPQIAAQVGPVQKVEILSGWSRSRSWTIGSPDDPDPAFNPSVGSNVVRVTGTSSIQRYRISWGMSESGEMTINTIENLPQ
jgi:hypothetical protein